MKKDGIIRKKERKWGKAKQERKKGEKTNEWMNEKKEKDIKIKH